MDKLHLAVAIVGLLVNFIKEMNKPPQPEIHEAIGDENEGATEHAAKPVDVQIDISSIVLPKDMGEIVLLPSQTGLMLPAKDIFVNDATWMGQSRSSRINSIQVQDALLLGARSMREHLFSGKSVICPNQQELQNMLSGYNLERCLGDLVSFCDHIGSNSMHFFYDDNDYPVQSLMRGYSRSKYFDCYTWCYVEY